jgi:hypothetical protein
VKLIVTLVDVLLTTVAVVGGVCDVVIETAIDAGTVNPDVVAYTTKLYVVPADNPDAVIVVAGYEAVP